MKILLIRHGETNANLLGVLHKPDDPEGLNENGQKQALAIGETCRRADVRVIYTSSEKRAVQTAEVIGVLLGLKPIIVNDFRERNFGAWSNRPWSEIQLILGKMESKKRYTSKPPGGESWRNAELRLMQALGRIVHSQNSNIAIITHMGAIRIMMPILKGEHKEMSYKYDFANGSITTFLYANGKFRALSENDTSHLT